MAGYTIIHLSDLHIGTKEIEVRQGKIPMTTEYTELSELTAERLAQDFMKIQKEHSISFRTEETLLVITGDITHSADWAQYEMAIHFLKRLKHFFSSYIKSSNLLPQHIICIPGNHDIEIPTKKPQDLVMLEKLKYRNFKMFIDEVTDYSDYAKGFKLDSPFINFNLVTPFGLRIIDLNSVLHYNYREDLLTFTQEHINILNSFLNEDRNALRIALMHHRLVNFPGDDKRGTLSQESLRQWLIDKNIKLLLCGHAHKPVENSQQKLKLHDLTTGNSFLFGTSLSKGNTYQIIRIDPQNKPNEISLFKRVFIWETATNNYWKEYADEDDADPITKLINIPDMADIIGTTDYTNYIGIGKPNTWKVITHCVSNKFRQYGVFSPGENINSILIKISEHKLRHIEGETIEETKQDDVIDWSKYSGINALFLVDSPYYNHYGKSVIDLYGTYLAGGSVKFPDERDGNNIKQRIETSSGVFRSDKVDGQALFSEYTDYLLIMRLPAFMPNIDKTHVEVSDIDKKKVYWIIAGIHSKASYVGSMIFTPDNFQLFTSSLKSRCDAKLPDYLEAVYKIPKKEGIIDDFTQLGRPVHFSILRLKKELGMADNIPSGTPALFLEQETRQKIPIDTVHIDLVAACNFNCKSCIECDVNKKNIFISIGKYLDILFDLKKVECQNISFYGGEPTLHPDFNRILRLSYGLGFDIFLVTNGSRLKEEMIRRAIIEAKNKIHVRVSINGHSWESHTNNHGLTNGKNYYEEIKTFTKELIQNNVSVTISFLLYEKSIDEIDKSCKFWQKTKASAFVLRPITEIGGVSPRLTFSSQQKKKIKTVLEKHKGFVFTPKWFETWIMKGTTTTTENKEYKECYSSFYRMAISPYGNGSSKEIEIEGVKIKATDNAWISLCTYKRYDPNFGCEYPKSLEDWCQNERKNLISKIVPSNQCNDIYCCRHKHNEHIHNLIKSKCKNDEVKDVASGH